MVCAPWYLSNDKLHEDLHLGTVQQITSKITTRYIEKLHKHPNIEALALLHPPPIRRLKSKITEDITYIIVGRIYRHAKYIRKSRENSTKITTIY